MNKCAWSEMAMAFLHVFFIARNLAFLIKLLYFLCVFRIFKLRILVARLKEEETNQLMHLFRQKSTKPLWRYLVQFPGVQFPGVF